METALRGVGYKVFRNEEIAEGMHQIIVEAPIVAERAKAGQFLILKVDEKGGELSKRGYKVFMFEALHKLGGVLRYGMSSFRLPPVVLDKGVEQLQRMGVCMQVNFIGGRSAAVKELAREFDAVFVGTVWEHLYS